MKKYELLKEDKIEHLGRTLYRIKACKNFTLISGEEIKAGDLGGYIEKDSNLSHDGNAWIYGNAWVCDNAWVYGNAQVCDNAWVYGNARVCGDAQVCGNAWVCDNARVCGNAWVYNNARVCGNAQVCDNAWVCDNARVSGNARVSSPGHLFYVTPIGKEALPVTMFKTRTSELSISYGCYTYTIDEFANSDIMDDWTERQKEVALCAIELGRKHIDLTPDKEPTDV